MVALQYLVMIVVVAYTFFQIILENMVMSIGLIASGKIFYEYISKDNDRA